MSRPIDTGTTTRTRNSRNHKAIRELIDLIIRQGESSELLNCTTRQLIARCPNLETLHIDFTENKAYRAFHKFWTRLKSDIKAGELGALSSSSAAAQEAQPQSLSSSAAQEPAKSNLSMTHPSPSFAFGSNQESSNSGDSLVPRTYENALLGTLDEFTAYIGAGSEECELKMENVRIECELKMENVRRECDLKMENVRRECDLRTKEARKKIAFLQGPVNGGSGLPLYGASGGASASGLA